MKWVPREREDTADIYWSLAKKSRFLLQESRTWQNRTQQQYICGDDWSICSSCFFWCDLFAQWIHTWQRWGANTWIWNTIVNLWQILGKYLTNTCDKYLVSKHNCKFVTRMWRRQLKFFCLKTQKHQLLCVIFISLFAYLRTIHQSNLVLTLDKIILSAKRKHLYQNQGDT